MPTESRHQRDRAQPRNLDVRMTLVTPREMSFAHRQRLDHGVTRGLGVCGIVPLLRFTTANVAAASAHTEIEARSAALARLAARLGCGSIEVGTGLFRLRHTDALLSSSDMPNDIWQGYVLLSRERTKRFTVCRASQHTDACHE